MSCGTTGNKLCDEKPFVIDLLAKVIPQENVDPNKVFVTGCSKGGTFTRELMCAANTSSLFRAYLVQSASLRKNDRFGRS